MTRSAPRSSTAARGLLYRWSCVCILIWYKQYADPYHFGTDPDQSLGLMDPDPAIFFIDLQDTNKKLFKKKFFCLLLFDGTFTSFFKDKKSKLSQKTVGIKVLLTIFAG
jgi:hypothetical protein